MFRVQISAARFVHLHMSGRSAFLLLARLAPLAFLGPSCVLGLIGLVRMLGLFRLLRLLRLLTLLWLLTLLRTISSTFSTKSNAKSANACVRRYKTDAVLHLMQRVEGHGGLFRLASRLSKMHHCSSSKHTEWTVVQ